MLFVVGRRGKEGGESLREQQVQLRSLFCRRSDSGFWIVWTAPFGLGVQASRGLVDERGKVEGETDRWTGAASAAMQTLNQTVAVKERLVRYRSIHVWTLTNR